MFIWCISTVIFVFILMHPCSPHISPWPMGDDISGRIVSFHLTSHFIHFNQEDCIFEYFYSRMYLLSHYTTCFILLHVDQCNKGRVFPRIRVHVLFLKTNCGKAFIPELWAVLTKVGTNVITILKIMLLTKLFLANSFLCCNVLGLEYWSDCSFWFPKYHFRP